MLLILMFVDFGASGANALKAVMAVCRSAFTAFSMESNVASRVLMVMEINNNGSATSMSLAQLIAKVVGVSFVSVLPPVVVESSLACTPSPNRPCMVANLAQRRMVPWRTTNAAQNNAKQIAGVIGVSGVTAPMVVMSTVVQEAPSLAATL